MKGTRYISVLNRGVLMIVWRVNGVYITSLSRLGSEHIHSMQAAHTKQLLTK